MLSPVWIGIVVLYSLPVLGVGVGRLERWRIRLMQGPDEPPLASPHLALPDTTLRQRIAYRRREPASLRALGYTALMAFLVGWVDFALVLVTLLATGVLALSPLIASFEPVGILWWEVDTPAEALPLALLAAPAWVRNLLACRSQSMGSLGWSSVVAVRRPSWERTGDDVLAGTPNRNLIVSGRRADMVRSDGGRDLLHAGPEPDCVRAPTRHGLNPSRECCPSTYQWQRHDRIHGNRAEDRMLMRRAQDVPVNRTARSAGRRKRHHQGADKAPTTWAAAAAPM